MWNHFVLEKRLNQHADDTILVRIFISAGAAGNAAIQVAAGTHMDAGAEGKPIQLSLNIGNVSSPNMSGSRFAA